MPIILTILAFMWWWPIGLLILGFMIARGRCGFWRRPSYAGDGPMLDWEHGRDRFERKMARMQDKMEMMRSKMERVPGRARLVRPGDQRQPRLRRLSRRNAEAP